MPPNTSTMPLVRLSDEKHLEVHGGITPYRIIATNNNFLPFPEHWPPYHNVSTEPCDMLQGPCVCGAWHQLCEWAINPGAAENA